MSSPRVSVLLPAYNAAATLPACLRSIQRQTESDWECIVVDDGSTDETLACARRFAERDRRVVAVATPHRGVVAALNAGLERCRGAMIARMDADDLMRSHRLAAQLRALDAEPAWVAVGCHVRIFPRRHLQDGWRAYERWVNRMDSAQHVAAEAFVECPIVHPTLMIRRRALLALRYRDRGWPEDYDLILRLLARGDRVGVVPRRLLCWRDGPQRLSRTGERYEVRRFTACKAAFLADRFLDGVDSYVLWGYGHTGRALRRALLAEGKRASHIVEMHPGRLGNTIHGAPVIRPGELARLRGHRVVVSVSGEVPRRRIRAAMAHMGFRELLEFVCAA